MMKVLLSVALVVALVSDASAGLFGRRGGCSSGYCNRSSSASAAAAVAPVTQVPTVVIPQAVVQNPAAASAVAVAPAPAPAVVVPQQAPVAAQGIVTSPQVATVPLGVPVTPLAVAPLAVVPFQVAAVPSERRLFRGHLFGRRGNKAVAVSRGGGAASASAAGGP